MNSQYRPDVSGRSIPQDSKSGVVLKIAWGAISFVASLALCVLFLSCILLWTLTPDRVLSVLEKTGYVDGITPFLEEELNELGNPSGLPEHFFTGKTDKSVLEKLLKDSVEANFAGEAFHADTGTLREELKTVLLDYAAAEDITASDEAVDSLVTLCENEYIRFGSPRVLSYLGSYGGKIAFYLKIAAAISLVAAMFLLVYLFRSGKTSFARFAIGGAGIMLSAGPLILLLGQFLRRLGIRPEPVNVFTVSYVETALVFLAIAGGVLILLSVGLIFLRGKRDKA